MMHRQESPAEDLLTLAEAAAALGITPVRLLRLVGRNVAQPVDRRGRRKEWQFSRAEVERLRPGVAWLERQRVRRAAALASRRERGL